MERKPICFRLNIKFSFIGNQQVELNGKMENRIISCELSDLVKTKDKKYLFYKTKIKWKMKFKK